MHPAVLLAVPELYRSCTGLQHTATMALNWLIPLFIQYL